MGSMLHGLIKTAELTEKVKQAISHSHRYFRGSQHPDGYWWGELESNPTMEAEYLMLSHFLGRENPERWRKVANYILTKQQTTALGGSITRPPET